MADRFPNLLIWHADVTSAQPNGTGIWDFLYPRVTAIETNGTLKTTQDRAHGVGDRQALNILIYRKINEVLERNGAARLDLANDASIGSLIANGTSVNRPVVALVDGTASHAGEPASFRSILSAGVSGNRYRDRLNRNFQAELDDIDPDLSDKDYGRREVEIARASPSTSRTMSLFGAVA